MLASSVSWLIVAGTMVCPASPVGEPADLEALYRSGIPFAEFLAAADDRREAWKRNYGEAELASEIIERAAGVGGTWYILAVAEDWCSDSVSTIPYLARLAEITPGLELRIVDSDAGRGVMEAHPTPDGRAATPTVLVLDTAFEAVGCWIERPSELQDWAQGPGAELGNRAFVREKMRWYDTDGGGSTVAEIVALIESAAAGHPTCPAG